MTLDEFLLARIAEDEASLRKMHGLWDTSNEEDFAEQILADCEAKRRIVELHHAELMADPTDPDEDIDFEVWSDCEGCYEHPPCSTLRFLAAPYADHEDYAVEWKPRKPWTA